MTFGEKIKSARKAKGYTQKELADMIGAKHNSVSDWENNKNKPDIDTVEYLCGVLDIIPNDLMGNKTREESGNIIGKAMKDSECIDMIQNYYNLNSADKKAVQQIIKSLAKRQV